MSASNALAKLEPYLLLAKSARGAAAAKLIMEATAAPGCYVFSELLEVEGIKELASSDQFVAEYNLLNLFAFGTLAQYQQRTYPQLKSAHLNKLRQLTLVSLAAETRVLSYFALIQALQLQTNGTSSTCGEGPSSHMTAKDIRELEDIIIDATYAGLLSARLDQRKQRIEVESVMGRDVKGVEDIGKLTNVLEDWSKTTTQLLDTLASRIEQAKQSDINKAQQKIQQDHQLRGILMQIANTPSQGAGAGGTFGGNGITKSAYDRMGSDRVMGEMEMDDDMGTIRKKKASTGGPMRSKRSRA